MFNRIRMDEELLSLIIMVQNYRKFIKSQAKFNGNISVFDDEKEVEKFLNTIPVERLNKYNLNANRYSMLKLISYPLTNELMSTEKKDLYKFEF